MSSYQHFTLGHRDPLKHLEFSGIMRGRTCISSKANGEVNNAGIQHSLDEVVDHFHCQLDRHHPAFSVQLKHLSFPQICSKSLVLLMLLAEPPDPNLDTPSVNSPSVLISHLYLATLKGIPYSPCQYGEKFFKSREPSSFEVVSPHQPLRHAGPCVIQY